MADRQCLECGASVPYQGRGRPREVCHPDCAEVRRMRRSRDKWRRNAERYNAARRAVYAAAGKGEG